MDSYIFVAHGDLAQLSAHAITFSASTYLGPDGDLFSGFRRHVPGFEELFAELPRPCQGGDAFWLPLPGHGKPHGVVVVAATGGDGTIQEKRQRAVRAAITTALKHLRPLHLEERLLLALPAFRLGQGGDRRHSLASACTQIETAREMLQHHPGVDVAFVTYTPGIYQVFLEARRKVLGKALRTPPVEYPPALASELDRGDCVLFIGAGVSQGAGLPSWSKLIAQLAAELGVQPRDDLDFYLDLAQWYADRFGSQALANNIHTTYGNTETVARPTLAHYLLMSLPVRYVITTNYDDLLERTLEALRRHPVKVVRQEDVARTGQSDATYVVKFHGDAGTRDEPIILSRDDYEAFFDSRPAMAALLEGLLLNQTFFFVGYGLKDPNFRQIYHRIARMLKGAQRRAFATSFDAAGDSGTYLAKQWKKKGLCLIRIPGADLEEQKQHYLRLLDHLAERAVTHAPRLFLADDVEATPPLRRLREHLRETVGEQIEAACCGDLSPEEARHVAQVLEFMMNAGWRASPRSHVPLWRLWETLAERVPDRTARRRMLITALRHTESFSAASRIRRKLDELDRAAPAEEESHLPDPPE